MVNIQVSNCIEAPWVYSHRLSAGAEKTIIGRFVSAMTCDAFSALAESILNGFECPSQGLW